MGYLLYRKQWIWKLEFQILINEREYYNGLLQKQNYVDYVWLQ